LTYSGWLAHISGHPSATSRAQDSESTSAKDQCSTAGPCHQPKVVRRHALRFAGIFNDNCVINLQSRLMVIKSFDNRSGLIELRFYVPLDTK